MKDIKILVACHKPSVLPKSNILVPVQVGAGIASKRLDNMYHDDEGDNISKKNPNYCELTAMYWGWKNVKADYYGLCHYRRFLCFHDDGQSLNVRNQIEAEAITEYNLKRFGLENDDEMRAIIEKHDIVCGMLQDVRKLYTPRGNKATAMEHWTAHHRALIMNDDLKKMLQILDEVSPNVGKEAKEYLSGHYFLGFNCFVMKKSLFDDMCQIVFSVLERLEQRVDMSHYNQQISRIYGFMAEIIISSYISYIEKNKQYSVKHVPLVYFNYTDSLIDYPPVKGSDVIPVYFSYSEETAFLFGVQLRNFLDHIDENYKYDIIAGLNEINAYDKKKITLMCSKYENVSIRFLDTALWKKIFTEQYGKLEKLLPFIPWILKKYDHLLVFGSRVLFKDSIVSMWEDNKNASQMICAPWDILMHAKVNDIFGSAEEYLKTQMKDPYDYYFADSMVWNLKKARTVSSIEETVSLTNNQYGDVRADYEIINIQYEKDHKLISQCYNVMYMCNGYLKYQLPYAPLNEYQELIKFQKSPVVISYILDMPWFDFGNEISDTFWDAARRSGFYEQCMSHMIIRVRDTTLQQQISENRSIVNKIFPKGRCLRKMLNRFFPHGSKRYDAARKVMRVLHMN